MAKVTFIQSRSHLVEGINKLHLPTGYNFICADSFWIYFSHPVEEEDNREEVEVLVADSSRPLTLEDSISLEYIDSFSTTFECEVMHVYQIHKPAPTMRLIDESN